MSVQNTKKYRTFSNPKLLTFQKHTSWSSQYPPTTEIGPRLHEPFLLHLLLSQNGRSFETSGFDYVYYPVGKLTHLAGISPFLIGNTCSIRVHFPASYVSLPECNKTGAGCPSQTGKQEMIRTSS